MKKRIHVACNIDDGYVQHCGVMLVSLFENNKNELFDIHIIADSLSKKTIESLTRIVSQYNNQVHFYFEFQNLLKDCSVKQGSWISLTTYYRCFLDLILPPDIEKVIYFDCDLIVMDSISDLWNIDITNYALGAVDDMGSMSDHNQIRLKYDVKDSWFNAGMLLVNLDYWRKNNTYKLALELISQNKEQYIWFDQDVLNSLFHDKKLVLPVRWNMQAGFFRTKRSARKEVWPEIDDWIHHPSIVHFNGRKKPWNYQSIHPYKKTYYTYLEKTEWRDFRPAIIYVKWLEININKTLNYLHILKPKYINVDRKMKIHYKELNLQ